MIYITGDTHRDFQHIAAFCDTHNTTKNDVLIILGDAGINYYGKQKDHELKTQIEALPITFFSIHGNHERRPEATELYREKEWHSGSVYVEDAFPSLLFAKDGEIYDFSGKHCVVIGGAYSVDKKYRLARNWGWWDDEQPSDKIKKRVESRLEAENWAVDIVLSHTCPYKYMPYEVFLTMIDQSTVDNSTEKWLDNIEDRLTYNKWYCGHFHTSKIIDKLQFMFNDFMVLT
jgi:3-oxoacid CoA-transferase subunit A